MATILDGKTLANDICQNLKQIVNDYNGDHFGNGMRLVIVSSGNKDASKVYVSRKLKKCCELGINCITLHYDFLSKDALNNLMDELEDLDYPPFIIQLPITGNITRCDIFNTLRDNILSNEKYRNINSDELIKRMDVDGLVSPINLIAQSNPEFFLNESPDLLAHINFPCTPLGIMTLLEKYNFNFKDSHAVILGRSELVGKPLERMLLDRDCTVTICHSKTPEITIEESIDNANLIISAMGNATTLTYDNLHYLGDSISEKTLIDVGTNRDVDGNLRGDCDPEILSWFKAYTPVPGGVGPMTVAMLMCNVVKYYQDTYNHDYAGFLQAVYPMKYKPKHMEIYKVN